MARSARCARNPTRIAGRGTGALISRLVSRSGEKAVKWSYDASHYGAVTRYSVASGAGLDLRSQPRAAGNATRYSAASGPGPNTAERFRPEDGSAANAGAAGGGC